jgi:hypothetical protein
MLHNAYAFLFFTSLSIFSLRWPNLVCTWTIHTHTHTHTLVWNSQFEHYKKFCLNLLLDIMIINHELISQNKIKNQNKDPSLQGLRQINGLLGPKWNSFLLSSRSILINFNLNWNTFLKTKLWNLRSVL